MARLVNPARMQVTERSDLDDWVHDSGRLLVVGEAAHPYPVRAVRPPVRPLARSRATRCLLPSARRPC